MLEVCEIIDVRKSDYGKQVQTVLHVELSGQYYDWPEIKSYWIPLDLVVSQESERLGVLENSPWRIKFFTNLGITIEIEDLFEQDLRKIVSLFNTYREKLTLR